MVPGTTVDEHEHHHAHGPANRRRWIMRTAAPLFVRYPAQRATTGVLVLHDAHGLDGGVEQRCRDLAGLGNLAAAPYLYYENGGPEFPPEEGEAARSAIARIALHDLDTDIAAAVEHCVEKVGIPAARIGVLGFGLGGYLAARASSQHTLAGAVAVDLAEHAAIPWHSAEPTADLLRKLRTPWLGLLSSSGSAEYGALVTAVADSNGMADVHASAGVASGADEFGAWDEAVRFLHNQF